MTDWTDQPAPGGSPEGRSVRPRTAEEVADAVDLAFDYRGNVTIELISGRKVEGYVYNRDARRPRPCLSVFPRHEPGSVEISYDEIVVITFSGEDTAFGKSWQTWADKLESQRRAEAERLEKEARSRGHL